jgi:1-acyl-sn-glycerol-3-phosphate acyltransferase
MLRKLYLIWAIFWVVTGFIVTMPINMLFLSFKKTYPIAHFIRKIWAYIIFLPNGMWVKVEGKQHVKGLEKFIYAPNHSSYIDIPASTIALPGVLSYMAKEELARFPIFGYFFKTIDIGVKRSSARDAYSAFLEMGKRLEDGQIPLIFPEGTIPKTSPILGNFKIGAFRLAIEKQVPIVPVTMIDNASRFPNKKPIIASPGKMRVTIHRPIPTENLNVEDAEQLKQKVFAIIEAELKKHHSNYEN